MAEIIKLQVAIDQSSKVAAKQDVEKFADELGKTSVKLDKTKSATDTATVSTEKYGKSVQEATKFQDLMGDSLLNIVAKMAAWQVMGNLIAKPIRQIRNAIEELKAMDDELVVVRKVTGATTEELSALTQQSYEVAQAYGVAASEYLASVAEFSRAGYGDAAEALGELSVKTQIVGDVSEETADQFLLSVDAAYQLGGSISSLTRILDGANEIDNNYATSIEKITEGLGAVAPVAAQANVSVDELTAAIGTITAVTQRSGTEAARALRALFLNILGDTKTEIDEGVTWTTGEIAGLRDVLEIYASDVVEAADATGELIDPMEAIGALAQSMQDGLLTEQQLMSMVSDIGGKLRSSQLLALIQNWDMYKEMLGDFGDAAGSADKEVSNAMDSWSRKTQQLEEAWTKLVSNVANTEAIKGALDIMIQFVQVLNDGGGVVLAAVAGYYLYIGAQKSLIVSTKNVIAAQIESAVAAEALDAATAQDAIETLTAAASKKVLVSALNKQAIAAISASVATGEMTAAEGAAAIAALTLETGIKALWVSLQPMLTVAAIAAGVVLLVKAFNELNVTLEEQQQQLEDVKTELENVTTEYEALIALQESNGITDAEQARLDYLTKYKEQLEQIRILEERESVGSEIFGDQDLLSRGAYGDARRLGGNIDKFSIQGTNATYGTTSGSVEDVYEKMLSDYADLLDIQGQIQEALNNPEIAADAEMLQRLEEAYAYVTDKIGAFENALEGLQDTGHISFLSELAGVNDKVAESAESAADSVAEQNDALSTLSDELNDISSAYDTLQSAVDEYNENGAISLDTLENLAQLSPEYLSLLFDENGQLALNADALYNMGEAAKVAAIEKLKDAAAADMEAYAAGRVSEMSAFAAAAVQNVGNNAANAAGGMITGATAASKLASSLQAVYDGAKGKLGSSFSSKSAGLEAIMNAYVGLANSISNISISSAKAAKSAAGSAGNAGSAASAAADAAKLAEEAWSNLEKGVNAALKKYKKNIEAQKDAIDDQIDALKAAREAEKDSLELEEKKLAVLEAQDSLLAAQSERTIRVYNQQLGQWEWIQDEAKIQSAQSDVADAEKDLSEYIADKEYDDQVSALEAQKDALQAQYDAIADEWERITDSLETPAQDIADALAEIAAYGTPAMKSLVSDVNGVLADMGVSLAGLVGKINIVDTSTSSGSSGSSGGSSGGSSSGGSSKTTTTKTTTTTTTQTSSGGGRVNRVFDDGGIARKQGLLAKAIDADEVVLAPDMANKILTPQSNREFTNFSQSLGLLFGVAKSAAGNVQRNASGSITNNSGATYYINGVEIGSQVAETQTLSQILRVLPLHTNE